MTSGDPQADADELDRLLHLAAEAHPHVRIELRDDIALFGSDAVRRIRPWLKDPGLAAFAVRVLARVCLFDPSAVGEVDQILQAARVELSMDSILADIDQALIQIGTKPVPTEARSGSSRGSVDLPPATPELEKADLLQAELARRFQRLRAMRPAGFSIFGLEHDLSEVELRELGALVRIEAHSARLRDRHWLIWIAYGAELAYRYDGDEYWTTFRAQTPDWPESSRAWLKSNYQRFSREYGGPQPTGAWADAFTIISWPITNAILPTDLQRHLARAMFMARYQLSRDFESLEDLGRTIANSGWHGSNRFQTFLEQPRLLGQVAFALLRPQQNADSLISPITMGRLAADLAKERSAAGWLRGAKAQFDHSQLRLIASSGTRRDHVAHIGEAEARTISPEILFFRRGREWRPFLSLPSLEGLARDNQVRMAILKSRARAPSCDVSLPPEALFRGYLVPVAHWPKGGDPLVRFEDLAAGLESALLSAWTQPPGILLCRVERDGSARQVSSKVMRPSHTYLVASGVPIPELVEYERSTGIDCSLYELRLDSTVSREMSRLIHRLGLSLATNLALSPLLVAPIQWSVDSSAVWLVGDEPILGLTAGRDLALIEVSLGLMGSCKITNLRAGSVSYFQVPAVPAGTYDLRIREVPSDGDETSWVMSWTVREPEPVSTSGTGPLRVWVDPYSRDLGELWDGKARIAIQGNRGPAGLTMRLAKRILSLPVAAASIPVELPIAASDWPQIMDQFVKNPEVAAAYDESRIASVNIDAGLFGQYSLEFERVLPALRWHLNTGERLATLVDDGALLPAIVYYSSFDAPLDATSLQLGADRTIKLPTGGGLLVAESGTLTAVVLASPTIRVFRSLADLAPTSIASPTVRSVDGVIDLIRHGVQWTAAPLPGDVLVRTRRSHVEEAISDRLVRTIAGDSWADRETDPLPQLRKALPLGNSMLSSDIDEAFNLVSDRHSVVSSIEKLYRHASQQVSSSTWGRVTADKGNNARAWAAAFCVQIAQQPFGVTQDIRLGTALILEWPVPYKVARALMTRSPSGDNALDGPDR